MTQYVLIKRDLFECPEHMGYTGIRDKAGLWDETYIRACGFEIDAKYSRRHGHYALPLAEAPEFTTACFDDIALAHVKAQRDALAAENAALRAQIWRVA